MMNKIKYYLALALCAVLAMALIPQALAAEVPVAKVNLSPNSLTLTLNGSEQVFASVEPGETTQTGVIFSSSDTSVATVDSYGNIKGVRPGTAFIYATSASNSGIWSYCTVTVLDSTKITVSPHSISLKTGYTAEITTSVSPDAMMLQGVSYRSSDPNVAVVSNSGSTYAVITGTGVGTATIYASAADGTMDTCTVVVGEPVTAIKVTPASRSINTGSNLQLSYAVEPVTATNKGVTWKSSNTNVATVDSNGYVTTWCAGYANITATSADGSEVSGVCYLTVVGVDVTHVPTAKPSPTPQPTLAPGSTATPPPYGVTAYVNTAKGSLNLRATASQNGTILARIPEKGSFTLLEKGNTWCKAWYQGVTGYVMTAYVRFDKPLPTLVPGASPTPTAVVTAAPGSPSGSLAFVNTVSGSLNMRATASSGGKVVRRIPQNAAFTVISYGSNWCYAWYSGTSGYVMTRYVRLANATATPIGVTATPKPATIMTPTPEPISGSRAQVVSSNGASVNLRSAASTTSSRVRLIPTGAIVDVLTYGKEWCYASYNGSTGYIMTKFLFLGTGVNTGSGSGAAASPTATAPVSTSSTKYAQVNTGTGGLNLRKGPGNGYTRITIIPKNAYVTLVSEGSTWSQVTYNGVTGYVMTAYLKKL